MYTDLNQGNNMEISAGGNMNASSQPPVTPERIMQLVWGYAPPLILEAAIRHRVFDVLDGGPKTADEVENATGASAGRDRLGRPTPGRRSVPPAFDL